jgi:putative hemolysin
VEQARYVVSVASTAAEVEEAQRLRWQVFVDEQGATPDPGAHGVEADRYDPYCQHLIVRDMENGVAVGTYRVLTARQARRLGGFYTEQEFDLGGLSGERDRIVEIGRSCVHPEYRSGVVIALLWAGLAGLIVGTQARFVIGCASISMSDGGREAASIYRRLVDDRTTVAAYQMMPRNPLDLERLDLDLSVKPPPLIKGYLRAGAELAGPPAVDEDFGTADLPIILTLDRLSPRYARHFIGS